MTKEEYFQTPWKSDLDIRTVDRNGREFYYPTQVTMICMHECWFVDCALGLKYDPNDVADWWRESLQTREEYLKLQNQPTNE